MRTYRSASDLLVSGWLPPRAAADKLGISERQLRLRFERGEIRRRSLVPNGNVHLYEVDAKD